MGSAMDDVRPRIEMIFARLFPGLDGDDILGASIYSVRDWDSIATLSLIVEAEDEFGISIGFDAAEDIETFGDLCRTVVQTYRNAPDAPPPRGWLN